MYEYLYVGKCLDLLRCGNSEIYAYGVSTRASGMVWGMGKYRKTLQVEVIVNSLVENVR